MTTVDIGDVKLEGVNEPLQFTQAQGLQKTYAHYLLFKEGSPTLNTIIEVFVPDKDKQELFKKMFTVLNKKHVKAGLEQFGVGFISMNVKAIEDLFSKQANNYGITYSQLYTMIDYSKPIASTITDKIFDKMDREIYENKFLIDAIHEAVIHYFPKNNAIETRYTEYNTILQKTRKNLQKSLQGYIGTTRSAYIKLENIPENIENIGNLKTEIAKIKTNVVDNLPNVLHLEAVAELHRYAHDVKLENALPVVAHASINNPPSQSKVISDEYINFLANYLDIKKKNIQYVEPYYVVNDTNYLVFKNNKNMVEVAEIFKMSDTDEKPKTDEAPNELPKNITDPKFNYSKELTIDSVDEIVKALLKAMELNIPTEYSEPIKVNVKINNNYKVTEAIGDGNCLYHSFLHLSKTYRMCDNLTKKYLAVLFRINLAKNLEQIIDKIKENEMKTYYKNMLEQEKKYIGWPKYTGDGEPSYQDAFKLYPTDWVELDRGMAYNYLMFAFPIIFVVKTGIKYTEFEPTESIEDKDKTKTYIYLWNTNSDVHFNIVTTIGNDPTPILNVVEGGTTTKIKTRKHRIFKKWKSRRQRIEKRM